MITGVVDEEGEDVDPGKGTPQKPLVQGRFMSELLPMLTYNHKFDLFLLFVCSGRR